MWARARLTLHRANSSGRLPHKAAVTVADPPQFSLGHAGVSAAHVDAESLPFPPFIGTLLRGRSVLNCVLCVFDVGTLRSSIKDGVCADIYLKGVTPRGHRVACVSGVRVSGAEERGPGSTGRPRVRPLALCLGGGVPF